MKKTLRELLRKEDKLIENLELYDFDYVNCGIESAQDKCIEIKDKLDKVRRQILIKLKEEMVWRSK